MLVIDIDSHFEPTSDWLGEFPGVKADLPDSIECGSVEFDAISQADLT